MRALLVPLAASTLSIQPPEPPETPSERFTVYVEADPRATVAPNESVEKVLEKIAGGLKKRKKWLFLTDNSDKAEVFVTVLSHRVREEHVAKLGTRVRDRARREPDEVQAIEIIDVNELSQRHYVLASVRVRGLSRVLAGHDGRKNGASLERAAVDLGRQLEGFLKANYWDLAERRRRFGSAGLELAESKEPAPPSSPSPTTPSLDPSFAVYLSSIEAYRRGDFVSAAMAISSLTPKELYRASTTLLAGERTSVDWKAAALLHTECVVTLPRQVSSHLELARRTALHLETAKRYSQAIEDPLDRERFQKRWHLATAYYFQTGFQYREALALLSSGLQLFPGDPEFLYAFGVFQEAAGALIGDRDRLAEAERIYRQLGEAKSPPADLDLRLAHVLLNLDRPLEAERRLQSVSLDDDRSDAALAAWMLRGEIARRRGDWLRARFAFTSAWKIDNSCQACAVAVAAAAERSGGQEDGSDFVARWLESPETGGHDGWWRFLLGPASRFESVLDELRAEVSSS